MSEVMPPASRRGRPAPRPRKGRGHGRPGSLVMPPVPDRHAIPVRHSHTVPPRSTRPRHAPDYASPMVPVPLCCSAVIFSVFCAEVGNTTVSANGNRTEWKEGGKVMAWVTRFRSGIAVVALAGGLATASGTPVLAATSATGAASPDAVTPNTPAISISAVSQFKPVTGDTFVVFDAGKYAQATIHSLVTGAASGDV